MGDNLNAVALGTGRTATKISCGSYHTCALLDNSNVLCWGRGGEGALGQGSTQSYGGDSGAGAMSGLAAVSLGSGTATDVKCGATHTCVLFSDGAVKCFGLLCTLASLPLHDRLSSLSRVRRMC